MSFLIDTHCHLTDFNKEEIYSILSRANEANVKKVLCVGASKGKESSFRAVEIAEEFKEVFASVGIHPHDADEHSWNKELITIAKKNKVLAIGETGLDYFKEWSDFEEQRKLFLSSINIAKELSKPLIIHCREAFSDCLKILKEEKASEVGGVFHCFSGTAEEALKLRDINFLVSYTGIITFKNANKVKEEARKIPLDQIMLETDTPYMAPEPYRGGKSEPAHVALIAKTLSDIYQCDITTITERTTQNAMRIFGQFS